MLRSTSVRLMLNHHMVQFYSDTKSICPICHKKDWCLISKDHQYALCHRLSSYGNIQGEKHGTSYVYRLNADMDAQTSVASASTKQHTLKTAQPASVEQCDRVYRAILAHGEINHSNLSVNSLNDLTKRGLSDETIKSRQFTSIAYLNLREMIAYDSQNHALSTIDDPKNHFQLADWLSESELSKDDWQGVAGCSLWCHKEYTDAQHQQIKKVYTPIFAMRSFANSSELPTVISNRLPKQNFCPKMYENDADYLIPAKDIDNHIFGMQIHHQRRNQDDETPKYLWLSSGNQYLGTSAHAGVNVSLIPSLEKGRETDKVKTWLHHCPKTVILTEGILKSIVTAELLEKNYDKATLKHIGAVVLGNGGVTQWQQFIPVLKQLHAINIVVAYDMDATDNQNVFESRQDLVHYLLEQGYHVALAKWDDTYKGIDDALLNHSKLYFANAHF